MGFQWLSTFKHVGAGCEIVMTNAGADLHGFCWIHLITLQDSWLCKHHESPKKAFVNFGNVFCYCEISTEKTKWSFLVGKPMVVGYHHFRKPPYSKKTTWCNKLKRPWQSSISNPNVAKSPPFDLVDVIRSHVQSPFTRKLARGWESKPIT